jgi:hypothetical protein
MHEIGDGDNLREAVKLEIDEAYDRAPLELVHTGCRCPTHAELVSCLVRLCHDYRLLPVP